MASQKILMTAKIIVYVFKKETKNCGTKTKLITSSSYTCILSNISSK